MKKTSLKALLLSVAFAALMAQSALAAGTPACTSIANTATVNFSVGNVPDPTGASASALPFIVGNKINFTVTNEDLGDITVLPGVAGNVINFLITNTGNADQRFSVTHAEITDGSTNPKSGSADNSDMDNPSTPTIMTGVLAPGGSEAVTIVADTPALPNNNDVAVYALIAQAYKVDGTTPEAENSSLITYGATTCTTDIVFADSDTDTDSGSARNGKDSARGSFIVSASATVNVTKSSAVYSDPINGIGTGAKAIPGAVVTYTITVTNPGTSSATVTGVTIADSLNNEIAVVQSLAFNTQFDDGADTCAAGQGIVVDNACLTNATGDDAADFTANVVNVAGANLAPGASTEIKFQVTVQ
ncbi:MAG: hypothetical protein U1D97_15130 [Desulfuromonadales bacterium]|nr:hypothetical protein [Desulfuromonadales bacterium]